MRDVSGFLHPHDEIADSLRLFALFLRSSPENCGTSQAVCTFLRPHGENCRQSHAVCSPAPKNAERLRLSAPLFMESPTVSGSEHPAHENCGTSWAVYTFLLKLPTASGCLHFFCAPVPKIAGRIRLFALFCARMVKTADSLRLFAAQPRKMRNVSGCVRPPL